MQQTVGAKTMFQQYQPKFLIRPEEYEPFIGASHVQSLKRLADPLEGKAWAHINSTFAGGGVAEMLRSLVPLARGLGIDARWYAITGADKFFQVTKKFHNLLQGLESPLSLDDVFETYLDTIDSNALNMAIAADMVEVHDPQPAGLISSGVLFGNVLWRCHIDTSVPNRAVWRFLLPYINQCAGAIFTMPEFVGPGMRIPVYRITPAIDPLAEKNRQYSEQEAFEILSPLFSKSGIDPVRPIFAAVSRYDIHKNQRTILRSFQLLRRQRLFDPPPYLIFLGNTATDDPEGGAVLEWLRKEAGDDPDVHFWVENNDRLVGALMRVARAFIHVSTREGFGLVVSEAMWQGTPVIGSKVGGIATQVMDGHTGYLVDAMDAESVAAHMARLLEDREEAETLGAHAKERVRRHFLLPDLMRRYLILLRFYTGVDHEPPPFRLDRLAYTEITRAVEETLPRCA